MSYTLSLDLGTKMGFCFTYENTIRSGVVHFRHRIQERSGLRFYRFQSWLNGIPENDLPRIKCIYFEQVRNHAGTAAAHIYGGFLGILTAWCEEKQISYKGVEVKAIKKFITGKGNASKEDVIQGVRKHGHVPLDDNEADAIALSIMCNNNNL